MKRPVSTYRLQLHAQFRFREAVELIPYFADLGVTHLYLSPIWRARPGSTHGYDVCDPGDISEELGGEAGYRLLSDEASAHGIGILLDFVSNHMCADSTHNPAWRDMLSNGPSSPFADYFDVDWHPVKRELDQKVLLPILGRQYGEILEAGELRIELAGGQFVLRYWEHNLPLNPRQCRLLLRHRLDELKTSLEETEPETVQEYLSVLFQLDHLPAYTEISNEAREDRLREVSIAGQRLRTLLTASTGVLAHVEQNIREFNGTPGDPASFNLLHELLERQAYRLSYWRTALHEINYRRFFDINELAGLRMESPGVFEAAHAALARLVAEGRADGVRLDHIDGLYDPAGYLQKLRQTLGPDAYIVVEKILSESEPLPGNWPVDGTTGYEFLNQLNRLYVRPESMQVLRQIYRRFSHRSARYEEVSYASKQQIITSSMVSELNVLAHEMNRMSEQDRHCRDFTLDSLQEALREVVACFPVYRTYIGNDGPSEDDLRAVDEAIRKARERNPAMESSIFAFLRECLCPLPGGVGGSISFSRRMRFAMKFQQYTGPVQAKGVEDTAFYRYCPLASLNEVGGNPAHIGAPTRDFHAENIHRQTRLPRTMIATSTHDTKRGEDARARINVLSEMPEEWHAKLKRWSRLTAHARTEIGDGFAPDRNDEYLFYQSLLAVWAEGQPEALAERLRRYMGKAVKEAKVHSSWINPSNEYDEAVGRFVTNVLTGKQAEAFLEDFAPFAERVAWLGALNSLSQLALKLASPGVTDFYQGTELWDLTLVDPDNRQRVEYGERRAWLASWLAQALHGGPYGAGALLADWKGGRVKAAVTAMGLRFRREHPELVIDGAYVPLQAEGPMADHVTAFARVRGEDLLVAAGLRWMAPLVPEGLSYAAAAAAWGDTFLVLPAMLPGRALVNILTNRPVATGQHIRLSELFAELPGALLRYG